MTMKSLAVLAFSLAVSAGEGEPSPLLFDCAGETGRYRLFGSGEGNFALEIEEAREGPTGVSTWLLQWTEARTGYVIGQQGGHQSHLRLTDGLAHYIFFEGVNGQLSGAPGVTYAGIVRVDGSGDSQPVSLASCEANETNRNLLENVQRERVDAGLPELATEDVDGPFDGWF
ncbi:MAG TPA: hypothetical protein VL094_13600 [Sphingomonadaceae bacterium]|nr:hypothetical protein [Sphingomonadaceae bacterium]